MCAWSAADYNQNSPNQQRWARELIAKLDLKGDEKILDIGCGDGKVTAEIASYVPNGSVLGIDNSENMIDFAQSRFPASNFPNLAFQQKDAKQLNFYNEFDVIVSFACLHWVSDHLPVLAGIKNSLKSSGRIFLQMGGKGNALTIGHVTEKVIYSDKWSKYFENFSFKTRFFSDDEYKDLLKSTGLKAQRVELIPIEMIHQGKEAVQAWIRTVGSPNYLCRVPEDLQSEMITEIVDTYLESYPLDSQGFARVPMIRLDVAATKI